MTRSERVRRELIKKGVMNVLHLSFKSLGRRKVQNAIIVQRVIFNGETLQSVGDIVGLSREQVRRVSLIVVKKNLGYHVE